MEPKIYMNYIHPSSLLKQLSELWKSDQLCDAVITVDKIIVAKAHKVVLLAASTKLKHDANNSTQSPILDVCLPVGISHRAVLAFLKYIYEGYLVLTKPVAQNILKISTFLEIKCLTNCCNDYLDSIEEDEAIIILDDEPPAKKEPKTEEFGHVRTSDPDDFPKRQIVESESDSSKRKKRRKSKSPTASPSRLIKSPSQHSQSPASDMFKIPSSEHSDVSREEMTEKLHSHKIKHEPGEERLSCDRSGWRGRSQTSQSSFPPDIELKEEPPEEFFQSISQTGDNSLYGDQSMTDNTEYADDSMGGNEMWYSEETGGVQTLNQTAPVQSMSSPMTGGFYPQRTMTPSLNQIRAQQSIKRSIQSSQSAARKARNMAGASASMAAPPSGQGENEGEQSTEGGSQEGTGIQCNQCDRVCHNRSSYQFHIKYHHPAILHGCHLCERAFPMKGTLTRHIASHTKERPFNCTFCPSIFSRKYSLDYHVMVKHSGLVHLGHN